MKSGCLAATLKSASTLANDSSARRITSAGFGTVTKKGLSLGTCRGSKIHDLSCPSRRSSSILPPELTRNLGCKVAGDPRTGDFNQMGPQQNEKAVAAHPEGVQHVAFSAASALASWAVKLTSLAEAISTRDASLESSATASSSSKLSSRVWRVATTRSRAVALPKRFVPGWL